jgi:nucleotide-binding universal stress UspA family protein
MFQRLLVPVDGSDLSDRAITVSVDLARQLGAAIVGFVAEPLMPVPSGPRPQALLEDRARAHDAMTEAHAQSILARFEARARDAGVAFEGRHDQAPNVDQAIVDAARDKGCDMIVMVTHGRGAFGELLFGSHTKAVMAATQLPLLILR